MSLCIPYLVLKPITTKLSAQKWFVNSSRRPSAANRRMLSYQIERSLVDASVRLGKAKLRVREFMALNPGDIIRLDQQTDHDLTLLIGNVPKYGGKPALRGKKLVFSVSEPLE
jgi:flagellar motor switch protein FliM